MKKDTHHRSAKFISSQGMVSSEMQKRIISLGKKLVTELGLDPGVDTLARWMAHYIAEQLELARVTQGDNKIEAEQRCFDTILKLWEHRSSLPNGRRPFESFEPIFRTLTRLNPENPTPYFYTVPNPRSSDQDVATEDSDEVQYWLDIAQTIDRAARVWLEYVFRQAALSATDEKTSTWLENVIDLPRSEDVTVIIRLLQEEPDNENKESNEQEQRIKQEKLRLRIKHLDEFIHFSQELRTTFEAELAANMRGDSSED